jgi:hypothetical protein
MSLAKLTIHWTYVSDFSPIRRLPLTNFGCYKAPITDLSFLRGMQLTELNVSYTPVSDLSPLEGMPLTKLGCNSCRHITTIAPLRGMALDYLDLDGAQVADLTPLQGMPLRDLRMTELPVRDLTPLRDCKKLAYLDVKEAHVDAAGIAALQKALPECKVNTGSTVPPAPAKTKP